MNPQSKHNIAQVIVHRFDKDGLPILGRERVCMNLRPINKGLERFDQPICHIRKMIRALAKNKYYTELDFSEAFTNCEIQTNFLTWLLSLLLLFASYLTLWCLMECSLLMKYFHLVCVLSFVNFWILCS